MTFLDVAALGTSRQQGGVPATGTPVDALTQSLDSVAAAGDERSVLLRAGALAGNINPETNTFVSMTTRIC